MVNCFLALRQAFARFPLKGVQFVYSRFDSKRIAIHLFLSLESRLTGFILRCIQKK